MAEDKKSEEIGDIFKFGGAKPMLMWIFMIIFILYYSNVGIASRIIERCQSKDDKPSSTWGYAAEFLPAILLPLGIFSVIWMISNSAAIDMYSMFWGLIVPIMAVMIVHLFYYAGICSRAETTKMTIKDYYIQAVFPTLMEAGLIFGVLITFAVIGGRREKKKLEKKGTEMSNIWGRS
jgi:hypothetical protein